MENKSILWAALRIVVVLLGFLQSPAVLRSMSGDFSKPSWLFPLIIAFLVSTGILFIFFIQTTNPRSVDKWHKPSWLRNPFNYKQPLQIFNLAAFYFISVGIGCLFIGLRQEPTNWAWELPSAIGCGIWFGIRLCMLVFTERFE